MQFKGAYSALITPFKDGRIDEETYRNFIEWQIEQGIDGLVPCGTTGESATLDHGEHKKAISICVDQAKSRVPVVAGAGSNATAEAIDLAGHARDAGADAALMITPYYNKPTQGGVVAHFKAIAKEVHIPMFVYNVPGRTALNVLPRTMARLFQEVPEVIGTKEASADLKQISEVVEFAGPDFCVLSGDDFTVLPLLSVGGQGVISVTSNIVPSMMSKMCSAFDKGDLDRARDLHYQMAPLCRAMFLETNPIPVKTAVHLMGKCPLEFRLPLVELAAENKEALKSVLKEHGLI
ncbi:MAG: 4-hydroxy-tetrahydrodipicolinate synthase [Desulfonatronovibrionaceae bacterium]